MRKFHALYRNEMIKISHKIIVIIILAIMVGGIIAIGGLIKIQQVYRQDVSQIPDYTKENMKSQLEFYKTQLADIEQRIENAGSDEEKAMLENEKIKIAQQIEMYQMAIDYDVNIDGGGYKAILINGIYSLNSQISEIEKIPVEERSEEQKLIFSSLKQKLTDYTSILETGDFARFISMKNQEIDQTETLTADEKKLEKETNLLWLKIDPEGKAGTESSANFLMAALDQIETLKRSLLYNIDFSSQTSYITPLTPSGRLKVENDIAVLLYKAENDLIQKDFDSATQVADSTITGMFGFGIFMIVCLMLITAGGAVSQEISTGSIKSLIISPVKRYKIFFAKVLSLLTVGIVSALLLYVTAVVVNGIFFGFSNGSSYIFAINGTARELNFFVFRFAFLAVNFIDVIVYMVFAYMLSIVTRNTAVSVGLSIAIYFGGNLVNTFVSLVAKGEWLKFIPFNNLSLASRIFPDSLDNIGSIFNGTILVMPSITFSLIYIAVMVFCFGYIALDSFDRRDIK